MFRLISRLKKALARLCGNVEGLADDVGEIRGALRQRIGLDPKPAPVVPAIENGSAKKRARV